MSLFKHMGPCVCPDTRTGGREATLPSLKGSKGRILFHLQDLTQMKEVLKKYACANKMETDS